MKAYRISGGAHPVFDGTGAHLRGGRWNSPGKSVIYAGESFAIAMLERLVYTSIGQTPPTDRYVEIHIPDDLPLEIVDPADLPGWDHSGRAASTAFGDRWYDEARTPVLLVPSAVTAIDRNVVINQAHPDFGRITALAERPVRWDQRLFLRKA